MFDLNAVKDFVAVIRDGGFSAAARRLGMPKSTLSKRVQDLEADLDVRLIERTTRALRLTAEGAAFYARAQRIVAEAEEAERFLQQRHDVPKGHLRISAPQLFGQVFLGKIAAAFRAAHPDVTLDIVLNDRLADLIDDGFDAAIRAAMLEDSSLVARHFADAENVVVASPALAAQWTVAAPADLARVPMLAMVTTATRENKLVLRQGDQAAEVVFNPVLVINALTALRDAAGLGAGFASVPRFIVEDDLAAGRLVLPLPEWSGPRVPLSIVYPSARFLTARLRAFIDVLVKAFPDRRL